MANAKALRQSQIGVVFNETELESFEETQPSWVFSPSYKFNKNITGYLALQNGEKAGIAQATNGISNLVKAEKTDAYELGFKSTLLSNTFVFNAALFRMDIKDYQQSSQVVDEYTTANNLAAGTNTIAYAGATANIPKVRSQGLEIDSIYSGIEHFSLRFAGAYTEATYVEFTNAAQPSESANLAVLAVNPQPYRKGTFDVNLVIKNLLDDDTPRAKTWNTITPAVPRWLGITFNGKL